MRAICLIPARLDATRFNEKLLGKLVDRRRAIERSVIVETYLRMSSYKVFDDVIVATNSLKIKKELEANGGEVFFSNKINHESGSDRIAEAARFYDADIIFNIQGDEPFIAKEPLEDIMKIMKSSREPLFVTSLMKELKNEQHIVSPNYVKVICSKSNRALNFSRSVIPFLNNSNNKHLAKYYEHVGVYAFTKAALLQFTEWEPTPLEMVESIECLRYLENDIPIEMVETDTFLLEIDTKEDLNYANSLIDKGIISLV